MYPAPILGLGPCAECDKVCKVMPQPNQSRNEPNLKEQSMKALIFLFVLSLVSLGIQADFTCPPGTNAACLDEGDTVCPASAKCVAEDAVCLDGQGCESERGYICGSQYDAILSDYEKTVSQYNQLTSENVDLRNQRLEQKNCVINAASVKDAIRCVR